MDEVEFAVDGTIVSKLKLFYMLLSTWRYSQGTKNNSNLKSGFIGC